VKKAALVLTWNPAKWVPQDEDLVFKRALAGDSHMLPFVCQWSVGNRREIEIGTTAFLLRQGSDKGLLGRGETVAEVFQTVHWDGSQGTARSILIRFTEFVTIQDRLPIEDLMDIAPAFPWNNLQQSGVELKDHYFEGLSPSSWSLIDEAWIDHYRNVQAHKA